MSWGCDVSEEGRKGSWIGVCSEAKCSRGVYVQQVGIFSPQLQKVVHVLSARFIAQYSSVISSMLLLLLRVI